jgi:hypothetical protein
MLGELPFIPLFHQAIRSLRHAAVNQLPRSASAEIRLTGKLARPTATSFAAWSVSTFTLCRHRVALAGTTWSRSSDMASAVEFSAGVLRAIAAAKTCPHRQDPVSAGAEKVRPV